MIITEKIISAFLETLKDDMKFNMEHSENDKWDLFFSVDAWSDKLPISVRLVRDENGSPTMLLVYHSVEVNIEDLGKDDLLNILALNRDINFAKIALLKEEEGIIGVTMEMPTVDISVEEVLTALVSVVQGSLIFHNFIDTISHRVGFRIPSRK